MKNENNTKHLRPVKEQAGAQANPSATVIELPIGAPRPLLDSKQVATILRTTVRTVQRLVKYRRLANIRGLGRHLRFRPETVEQFIKDLELYSARPAKLKKVA